MTLPDIPQRWVGHADLDAFYASVEQRDFREYRGRPEHRKPDGLTVVYPAQVLGFLALLPVPSLRRLGRQTQ
jgi:DNA polymerase-4